MAPLPTSVIGDGNLKVLWVPILTTPAAPKLTELSATGVIDLSCYLTAFAPATSEETVSDDRLCSRQTFARAGSTSDTLEVTYVYQGQLPLAADNKAQTTMLYLAQGFIVARWGKAFETPLAIGDIMDVYAVEAGRQRKQAPENASLKITQTLRPIDVTRENVAVVA